MVFNGEGTTGVYNPDTLTPTITTLQNNFFWVNHTFTHANLDAISYANATSEITLNNAIPAQFGLNRFSPLNLVQPDVSGLNNADFLRAARDAGIRYLISDSSKPEQGNPSPNTGRWSSSQPQIFVIPRRANNLFFNVSTPADWVAEYNCIYKSFWGRELTIAEILDLESQNLLSYMLRGELDPWMFHQANLVGYDGTHSLLSDLLDRTFAKYNSYMTLPVVSVNMNTLGDRMANRTTLRNSGISASTQPGVGIVLRAPVAMTVPITGLRVGTNNESYGGEWISYVPLPANQTVTFPLTAATVPGEAPTVNAGAAVNVLPGAPVVLTGTATDPNTPPRPLTYAWTQISGPAVTLSNATTLTATFTAPLLEPTDPPMTLGFTLTAGNGVVTSSATTTVNVRPLPPTVSVGAPQTADWGSLVTLTGTAADPNSPPRPLTYAWTQISGPPVTLSDANMATATFTAPPYDVTSGVVVLGFRLTASNPVSASATTTVTLRPVLTPGLLAVSGIAFSDGQSRRDAAGVNASAGDVLVALVGSDGPAQGGQTLTVFGGSGLTWRLVRRTNTQLGSAEIWTATAITALTSATVSAIQSWAGFYQSLTVMTFSGARGVGASEGASAPNGAPRVTLTTTSPGSLVFGVGNDWDNAMARTVASGQSLAHQFLAPVGDTMWVQSLLGAIPAAGTSVTLEDTAPTTDRWNYSVVEVLQQ
jgi:hypothetical protein